MRVILFILKLIGRILLIPLWLILAFCNAVEINYCADTYTDKGQDQLHEKEHDESQKYQEIFTGCVV